jgi:hypothetical protein
VSITNKEILEAVEIIKGKLPNGELTLLKKAVEDLQNSQDELKNDIRELKRQLLDPDDGVIVRVNKNSENRRYWEDRNEEVEGGFSHIKNLISWQFGVNKALWILFSAMIGVIVKIVFFTI